MNLHTRFLIRINLLPLYASKNYSEARFSWISCRTMMYLIMTYLPVILIEEISKHYATTDVMALLYFYCGPVIVGPIGILLICEAVCQLKSITLKPSLKFLEWSDFVAFLFGLILCQYNSITLHINYLILGVEYVLVHYGYYLAISQFMINFS